MKGASSVCQWQILCHDCVTQPNLLTLKLNSILFANACSVNKSDRDVLRRDHFASGAGGVASPVITRLSH